MYTENQLQTKIENIISQSYDNENEHRCIVDQLNNTINTFHDKQKQLHSKIEQQAKQIKHLNLIITKNGKSLSYQKTCHTVSELDITNRQTYKDILINDKQPASDITTTNIAPHNLLTLGDASLPQNLGNEPVSQTSSVSRTTLTDSKSVPSGQLTIKISSNKNPHGTAVAVPGDSSTISLVISLQSADALPFKEDFNENTILNNTQLHSSAPAVPEDINSPTLHNSDITKGDEYNDSSHVSLSAADVFTIQEKIHTPHEFANAESGGYANTVQCRDLDHADITFKDINHIAHVGHVVTCDDNAVEEINNQSDKDNGNLVLKHTLVNSIESQIAPISQLAISNGSLTHKIFSEHNTPTNKIIENPRLFIPHATNFYSKEEFATNRHLTDMTDNFILLSSPSSTVGTFIDNIPEKNQTPLEVNDIAIPNSVKTTTTMEHGSSPNTSFSSDQYSYTHDIRSRQLSGELNWDTTFDFTQCQALSTFHKTPLRFRHRSLGIYEDIFVTPNPKCPGSRHESSEKSVNTNNVIDKNYTDDEACVELLMSPSTLKQDMVHYRKIKQSISPMLTPTYNSRFKQFCSLVPVLTQGEDEYMNSSYWI